MIVMIIFRSGTVLLAIVMTLLLHGISNYDSSFYDNHHNVLSCHDIWGHDHDNLALHDDYHGCQDVFVVINDNREKPCRHDEYRDECHGVSLVMTNMTNFAIVMNIMVNVVMAFRLS